ncbi:MAG TPA: radical SAM protein [Minicystis sp.]|nr:radical SAM protein [Minicystis sp.]
MKALVKVGYACNENCTFCHTAEMREHQDASARVLWKIERAARLGHDMVVLSGGEPTIRPELLAWARRVAALGMDFGLVTNGLLLSYADVTRELVERCRLRYVYMSLHGGDAKVHASVVRADTFDKAVRALELLVGRVPDLTVNCVVTTANVEHLRGLVARLVPLEELAIKFSMTQPKGGGARAFDFIVPDVARAADRIADAIRFGLELRGAAAGPRFAHDGVPLCLLPGLEDLYDDLKTHRFATMIEADEDDFVPVDDVAKVHPPPCDGCALRGPCPGLYRGYDEARGHAALRPKEGPRSNSYTFAPERDVAWPAGAPCPLLGETAPFDRGRTLFLRLRGRLRLVRTETRDFTDVELLATKEELGQVYLDVSTKLAPDDFRKDFSKLTRSAACEACPARARCTGAWVAAGGDPFGEEEARVAALVAGLRGRVLDLGCGDGRYLEHAAPAARAGELDYLGVDPDASRLAALASRFPFARFDARRAEDVDAGPGAFDHVLVLRSYQHLEDPDEALGRAAAALRSGGTLTVADDVPFGLVRAGPHAARAAASRANGFEHRRNEDAARAAKRLARLPLRLVERRDVGPSTSNQWMLRYEKVGA